MKKDQVKTLKQYLQLARAATTDERDKYEKWRQYAFDLDAKLRVAIDRLQCNADGSYYKGECSETLTEDQRSKKTAIYGLMKIARMQERKP